MRIDEMCSAGRVILKQRIEMSRLVEFYTEGILLRNGLREVYLDLKNLWKNRVYSV